MKNPREGDKKRDREDLSDIGQEGGEKAGRR